MALTDAELVKIINDNSIMSKSSCEIMNITKDKVKVKVELWIFNPVVSDNGEVMDAKGKIIRHGIILCIPRDTFYILSEDGAIPELTVFKYPSDERKIS